MATLWQPASPAPVRRRVIALQVLAFALRPVQRARASMNVATWWTGETGCRAHRSSRFHRLRTALSVLHGSSVAMALHLWPMRPTICRIIASSSGVQGWAPSSLDLPHGVSPLGPARAVGVLDVVEAVTHFVCFRIVLCGPSTGDAVENESIWLTSTTFSTHESGWATSIHFKDRNPGGDLALSLRGLS